MNIIESEVTFNDLFDIGFGTHYIKSANMKISRFHGSIKFTDLTNALHSGKECNMITVQSWCRPDGDEVIYLIDKFNSNNVKDVFNLITEESDDDIKIYMTSTKSINTFSPFNINKLKPLKSIPTKWKVKDAVKALINNQFIDLKCTGKYTDDYAYDSATNYGCKLINNVLDFCCDLIESPSGWRVYLEGSNKVNVCCYHFNYNEFTLKI